MDQIFNITEFQKKFQQFATEREWEQFHTPKNLSMALTVEASELLQEFQWLTPEQSINLISDAKKYQAVKDELADILLYTVRMADLLKINLPEALDDKMIRNAAKYPIEKSRGNAKKYTEF